MKSKHFFSVVTVMSGFLIAVMMSFAGCAGRERNGNRYHFYLFAIK